MTGDSISSAIVGDAVRFQTCVFGRFHELWGNLNLGPGEVVSSRNGGDHVGAVHPDCNPFQRRETSVAAVVGVITFMVRGDPTADVADPPTLILEADLRLSTPGTLKPWLSDEFVSGGGGSGLLGPVTVDLATLTVTGG
jgi:hypothetical protein